MILFFDHKDINIEKVYEKLDIDEKVTSALGALYSNPDYRDVAEPGIKNLLLRRRDKRNERDT